MSFLGEIKRRKVFQVAVVYAIVAWLLVQIVDVLNDPLSLPGWLDTVVVVLLAVGFPVAVILAWAFDLTPDGVVRTPADDAVAAEGETEETLLPAPPTPAEAQPEVLRNSVAVLPLDNLSPNPDDAYFAAGIHEEILNYVAKIKDINVIARTSVKRYAGSDKPIVEIAAELGVGTIMEGSVRYAGDRVRVTAQLIDAATENHLWSEVYERELADIFAIQADIAQKIAAALETELSLDERISLEKLPTNSTAAYAIYLRALSFYEQRGRVIGASPELRTTVEDLLNDALEADPGFAAAYVLRANVFTSTLNQDPGGKDEVVERRAALEQRALTDLDTALQIDPTIGAAYDGIARIHQFNWRGVEARKAYERAVDLSPNDPDILLDFAVFLAETGDFDDALELARRGVALDPTSGGSLTWLSWVHGYASDFRAARDAQRLGMARMGSYGVALIILGHLERVLGNKDEALRFIRLGESSVEKDANPVYLGELVRAYGMLEQHEDAARIFSQLEEVSESRYVPSICWFLAYMGSGDRDQALHWLRKAVEDREPYAGHFSITHVMLNAYNEALLSEPEFAALRAQLGYQDLNG